MKRDTWLALGIGGVACLLMCAGAQSGDMQDGAAAQPAAPAAPVATPPQQQPGTGGSGMGTQVPAGTPPSQGTATQNANPGESPTAYPNSAVPEGRTTPPNPDANAGTGGTGNTGTGAPTAPTPPSAPGAPQGLAVVDAIYRGRVESVSPNEVVIDNAGSELPLEINAQTRIIRDGEKISATQLKEGERVRATVNLVGRSHTREIAVLTGDEARRDAATRRR